MKRKINLYAIVLNDGLGICHLLDKRNGEQEEIYLFYSEENGEHFIICEGVGESGYFYNARYYSTLEKAIKSFNEAK